MNNRIGLGYDIHRLVDGRKMFLGGAEIPYIKGFLGHSDGDVLLHAITDALLGAAGLGDIGEHFPDTDPKYLAADSKMLLKKTVELIKKDYKINNVDAVIIAQEPVLSPFKKEIQRSVASVLEVDESMVSIKAKTNEGLGEIGQKEAIAVYAVALLSRKE